MVIAKIHLGPIRVIVMMDFKLMTLYAMTSTKVLTETIRAAITLYV